MPPGAGLGALPALEVKRLHPRQEFFTVTEARTGQFIEIAAVLRLFLRQHAAFAAAYPGTGQLRAAGHGRFCFL